jgi:hypothetical protein
MQQEDPPILKTWKNLYLLVAATLVFMIIFLYLFTRYFQ